MDQTGGAPLNRIGRGHQVLGGDPLEQRRRRHPRADLAGQRHQPVRGDKGILGIGTDRVAGGDPVAGPYTAHPRADGVHGAGGLHAKGEGQVPWIVAGAVVDIDEIHPRRVDADEHLAWPG